MRFADDKGIIAKTGILPSILDNHHALLCDRVIAKGEVASGFAYIQSMMRLEPLTITVQKADQRYRNAKQTCGDGC